METIFKLSSSTTFWKGCFVCLSAVLLSFKAPEDKAKELYEQLYKTYIMSNTVLQFDLKVQQYEIDDIKPILEDEATLNYTIEGSNYHVVLHGGEQFSNDKYYMEIDHTHKRIQIVNPLKHPAQNIEQMLTALKKQKTSVVSYPNKEHSDWKGYSIENPLNKDGAFQLYLTSQGYIAKTIMYAYTSNSKSELVLKKMESNYFNYKKLAIKNSCEASKYINVTGNKVTLNPIVKNYTLINNLK